MRTRISNLGAAPKAAIMVMGALAFAGTVQAQGSAPAVLDRVVAVVSNQPILWSDVTNEIHFSVLVPDAFKGTLTPQKALDVLISRALIQQQITKEDATAAQPTNDEVQTRENDLRKDLPACVRLNCATDEGWQAFLKSNSLSVEQVRNYLRLRLQLLRFIEMRFRQGIHISPEEVQAYYHDKLVPQYANSSQAPSFSAVSARIEEILLEQQVNVLLGNWLDNLRKQGDVEVLDAKLDTGAQQSAGSGEVE